MARKTALERFMAKVEKKPDGCWHWIAGRNPTTGYGSFWPYGYAHRAAYELMVGPIPKGLHIDHLCRVRHCVNPEHLEPVTRQQNHDRGLSAKRDMCRAGLHAMTPDNTGNRKDGWRYCKACHRQRARDRRAADYSRAAPVTHGP